MCQDAISVNTKKLQVYMVNECVGEVIHMTQEPTSDQSRKKFSTPPYKVSLLWIAFWWSQEAYAQEWGLC